MESITLAVKEDVDEIQAVMKTAFASISRKDWYVVDDRSFVERHIMEEGYILKYTLEGRIAGFLMVRYPGTAEDNLGRYLPEWTEEMLYQVAHMESAAVLPEFRGRKIQKKLLLAAENRERERGTGYLMGTVHPDNCYSADNLEQAGYKCLLETEKYGGLKRKVVCKKIS